MSDQVRPGEVTITLDGDAVTLIPSARALLALSRKHGGLVGLSQSLQRMDMDAFVDVVAHSVPDMTPAQREKLPEVVFAAGIVKLSEPLGMFLTNLANGGRPPRASGSETGEGNA